MTDGVDITRSFDEAFYGRAGITSPDWSMPVSVDGRGFMVDMDPNLGYYHSFQRTTVSLLNTQQSQSGMDQSVVSPEVWRRTMDSWHMGAQQKHLDREDSVVARYSRSIGIDPWDKYGARLLHSVDQIVGLGEGAEARLEAIGSRLFAMYDSTVYSWADPTTAPDETHALPASGLSICSDGEALYVLCSDGSINRRAASGTWSTFATVTLASTTKVMLAYVKGHIVLGNGPSLYDVTSASPSLIYTHPLADWWWRDASEGLSVIYILGGMGDRWHLHSVGINTTTTALQPPVVAATLPDGEVAYAVATYLGYVLIGVNGGWRFGMPDSTGAVTYGRLVRTEKPVLCFEGQDRFVWFGLSYGSGISDSEGVYCESAGIGRLDLSSFVAPMTPASSSDLATPTSTVGVTRSVVSLVDPTIEGFGRRVFSVDGVGIYLESDLYVGTGYLETGEATFASNDKKMGLYAQVFHDPLANGQEVDAAVKYESSVGWLGLGSNAADGSTSMGNLDLHEPFNTLDMRITLLCGAGAASTPTLRRTEFRAVDIPGKASEWRIPLIITDQSNWDDVPHAQSVTSDYDFLVALVQQRKQFIFREGDRLNELVAVDFLWRPLNLAEDRSFFRGDFILYAREIK